MARSPTRVFRDLSQVIHLEYDHSTYQAFTSLPSLDGLQITNKLIGAHVELPLHTHLALRTNTKVYPLQ
jgi:hypothetical protein